MKMQQLAIHPPSDAAAAKRRPLGVTTPPTTHPRESFFFYYVKQHLISLSGVNTVPQGGLRIYTTIGSRLSRTTPVSGSQ